MDSNDSNNSYKIIEQCFVKYNPNEIAFSFNGGKDCCVVLDMLFHTSNFRNSNILILHFEDENEFAEIKTFLKNVEKYYGINIIHQPCKNIKDGLVWLKQTYPLIKAIITGVRSTDPWSSLLKPFTSTDPDWPSFIRVSPILYWSYKQVWEYIFQHHVPFCDLYTKGYTSIGTCKTTKPNPYLWDEQTKTYKPAWELFDGSKTERCGRLKF